MLGKEPNKVYDPFLKAGLGYKNPECLKKAIAAQPKMYHGEMLHSTNLKIDSPDSEETLEDAEESRLKMRNKMVQLDYGKLNALYETFVPQQEPSVEQTYFSIPSTSNHSSETKETTSDLPIQQMPKESKLLKMFDNMSLAIHDLRKRIDVTLLEDRQKRWMSDSQNSLREFYKTDVIPMSDSLSINLKELQQELIDEKNEMLRNELDKSSSNSKDIQANLLKRIKILENDFKRSQAQSIDFELKLQHQKEKIACDVSWKSRLSTLNDENVLLKTQADSVFDKAETSGTLLSVTPLPNKKVSNTKVNADRSKPVTSHSIPKNEQSVESSNSVRRPMSKDTKSKDRILKNTNDKRPSTHVRKMSSSVSIDSNKCETVIQIVLWIVDSGCSKHMTRNLSLLRNFVEKFMGTVHFENDHFAAITG
ncbi:hypothetical protein Tco_1114741, partial [Tanacetum coccineum]